MFWEELLYEVPPKGGQILLCTAGRGYYQEAGRSALGKFAPKFAELNDDILFGEIWSREEKLSLRDRSIVTITALMAQGLIDHSFSYHLSHEQNSKNSVITMVSGHG